MHHTHYILNKPFGFLSQFVNNQTKRKKKKLLGELGEFNENTMAIGRLDETSEGLLLLTTDGMESERIRSKTVEKEYFVQLDGEITEDKINLLKTGVEISVNKKKYTTLPGKALKLNKEPNFTNRVKKIRDERHGPTSWISITITEGKFRQVRKMTAAVGYPTLRLVRVRIGNIKLQNLEPGEFLEVEKLNV
jgi:23S rRNA pseudouridine2457 synthase